MRTFEPKKRLKNMDTLTIDFASDVGIEYDLNGLSVGITLEEWMDKLGQKLITHYGDDFRQPLNQARAERGLSPL